MKKLFTTLLLSLSISLACLADAGSGCEYKVKITLKNKQQITGTFILTGYEDYCYLESAKIAGYNSDSGMVKILKLLKPQGKNMSQALVTSKLSRRSEEDIAHMFLFKNIYTSKASHSGTYPCVAQTDTFSIRISDISKIKFLGIKDHDPFGNQIVVLSAAGLKQARNKKPYAAEHVGLGNPLGGFTIYSYSPFFKTKQLKEFIKNTEKKFEKEYNKKIELLDKSRQYYDIEGEFIEQYKHFFYKNNLVPVRVTDPC